MITLRNFSMGFGSRVLLDNVNQTFYKGQLTALIGRNGAGKSTLLRAMAGLNNRYSGEVVVDGHDIRTLSAPQKARLIAMVSTDKARVPRLRCEDIVAMGRAPYTNWIGRMQEIDREIVMKSLRSTGMESYAGRTMDTMSDGECQRIMIARALAQDTEILLLDEPTSFLDLPNRYELVTLLRDLAHNQQKCIIFSTHELEVAMYLCDNIALVDNGALYNQTVKEMADSGHLERLFHIRFRSGEGAVPEIG